jgi:hypothetical protein
MMDVLARVRAAGDDGMATAEYATCGVAATGFAAVLYEFLTSPTVHDILSRILTSLLRWPLGG